MLKKFTLVMAALVGAALVLIGCPTEAETETKYVNVPEMIHLDEFATSELELITALAKTGDLSIGLAVSVTLGDDLTIPAGKLVYILNSGSLATASTYKLTVEGQVYVGLNGTLTATAAAPVEVTTGRVGVVKGGTLSIDTALAVTNGAEQAETALGSAKVGFAAETTLEVSTAFANVAALTAALGYVGTGGTLDAVVTGSKPSDFQALTLGGKKLITTAFANETSTGALTVPAGLTLTAKSDDTLATITGLTVNGTFTTAVGTLAAVTTLTVGEDGELNASGATLAEATSLTVNGGLIVGGSLTLAAIDASTDITGTGYLEAGAVPAAKAKLIIESGIPMVSLGATTLSGGAAFPSDKMRRFTGLVTVSSTAVTFDGTVIFGGGLTLTAIGATFNEPAYFADSTVLTLSATQSIVTLKDGAGLVAGAPGAHPWVYDAVLQAAGGDAILTPDTAQVTLTFATGGSRGITQSAAGLTLSGKAHITSGATYTVPLGSDSKLTVAAGGVLTLGSGALEGQDAAFADAMASIVLTGDGSNPAKLVLAAKDADAALGGGGKLVLVGGGTALGTTGVIQVLQTGTEANLTATGPTDNTALAWTFTGNTGTTGITGLDTTTPKGFTSIEAATDSGADAGLVTFKAGTTNTAKLNKTVTAKGTA